MNYITHRKNSYRKLTSSCCCLLRFSSMLFDSHDQLKRAYDLSRGRTMIAFVFFWLGVMYLSMRVGRRLRDSGVSLSEEGKTQIAMLKEQGRLEREAQMKKSG